MDTTEHPDARSTAMVRGTPPALVALVWAVALIPLAWGFISTLMKAAALFE